MIMVMHRGDKIDEQALTCKRKKKKNKNPMKIKAKV
jgi:hypothetical protein